MLKLPFTSFNLNRDIIRIPKALILIVFVLVMFSNSAFAAQYPDKVVDKLGNGIANAVTGFVEIPKTMNIVTHRDGVLHGMTIGLFTGLANSIGRTLSGAFDIATFFVPTTPFVKPAFIWNDFNRETTFVEAYLR